MFPQFGIEFSDEQSLITTHEPDVKYIDFTAPVPAWWRPDENIFCNGLVATARRRADGSFACYVVVYSGSKPIGVSDPAFHPDIAAACMWAARLFAAPSSDLRKYVCTRVGTLSEGAMQLPSIAATMYTTNGHTLPAPLCARLRAKNTRPLPP